MTAFKEADLFQFAEVTNNAVGEALEDIAEYDVSRLSFLFVQFDVTTQAFDQFVIQARNNSSASYATLYSASADFTTPVGLLIGCSGDLTAVAAAASGWFMMDVRAIESVKIRAAAAAASAAVTMYGSGNE